MESIYHIVAIHVNETSWHTYGGFVSAISERGMTGGGKPNLDPCKLRSYKKRREAIGEAAHGGIDDSTIMFFLCVFSGACTSSCGQ
jgi:hypothetical protein